MSGLQYKTRAMTNPKGKARVYFCCHPKDVDRFFEVISDEILAKQNCAIWYPEDRMTARTEEYLEDLKQMQLFVVPVTTTFLCTENPALDVEIGFAKENHIPILPLMQESGLEEVFNRKCGDLQFLDKYNNDPTAISYDEKLEKYLSSVLIGDELAEKIRAAFDAYVFLSYRKKDRKYAQELMRLIHKNEFCRDIAIWYDEFLTPGEDFNNSIKDALNKSELFILTVTPNLINEENYIMTTEYPMAREKDKDILPMEMVPTDRRKLEKCYHGIIECINAYNEAEMTDCILQAVKNIAIKENDNLPEHNFFIGLAYLNGIDMEVDYEKALILITAAAETGLVEAMDKLIDMYQNGVGVERDYLKVVEWQEKKIERIENEYKEYGMERQFQLLFWAIIECGDTYKELYQAKIAESYYLRATILAEEIYDKTGNLDAKFNLSIGCERLGVINGVTGSLLGELGYLEKSMRIIEELYEEIDTVEMKRCLSISYGKMGDVKKKNGKIEEAIYYYEKSQRFSEEIYEDTENEDSRRAVFFSYIKMGDFKIKNEDVNGALKCFEKCVLLCQENYETKRMIDIKNDLQISFERLGNLKMKNGDIKGALEYYIEFQRLSHEIYEETKTLKSKRCLSLSYSHLGDVFKERGYIDQALEYYQKCLRLSECIYEKTGTIEARKDLSVIYGKIGHLKKAKGFLDEALTQYKKSLQIDEEIYKETGGIITYSVLGATDAWRNLSISYNNIGQIFEDKGEFNEAFDYYWKSLLLRENLYEKTESLEAKIDLSASYEKLGRILGLIGDLSEANTYCKKGLKFREEIYKDTGTLESKIYLSLSYGIRGNVCYKRGETARPEFYYEKGLQLSKEVYEETKTLEALRILCLSYDNMGLIQNVRGFRRNALKYYKKSINLRCNLIKNSIALDSDYDRLAFVFYKCSIISKFRKRYYLKRAMEIYKTLYEKFPQEMYYKENYEIIYQMYHG